MHTTFEMILGGITAVAAMAFPARARLDRASEPPVECPAALPVVPPGPVHAACALPIRFNKLVAHRELDRINA